MATRGPWSVKGIDTKAREAALQAARSEGVTLGDYLNRLLLEAEKADDEQASSRDGRPADLPRGSQPSGRQQAMAAPDTEMLDELFDRLETTDTRTALAVSGLERSVNGLVSRLNSSENAQAAMESRIELASDELQQAQEALQRRINRLEADDASDQTLRALRSLEGALERLAGRVHDSEAQTDKKHEATDGKLKQLDSRLNHMSDSVDTALENVVNRIEKTVTEAELRSEGAARHLSERVSTVEKTASDSARSTTDRLDKVESQVGTTLSRVSDTMDRLSKNIVENEDRSVKAFDLVAKLEEQTRNYRDDINTRLEGMDQSIDSIGDRMTQAETITESAIAGLESSFAELDDRVVKFESEFAQGGLEDMRREFEKRLAGVREELAATMAATREEFARQLEEAAAAPTDAFAEMSTAVSEMNKRLRRTELRQTQSVEAIGEEVAKLTETIERRVQAIEQRNESELSGSIRQQISDFANAFQRRLNELEAGSGSDGAVDAIGSKMNELAETLNKRVEASEERSASAIRDFTDHVTTLTNKLQAKQEESAAKLAAEIKASENRQQDGMSRAFEGVNERISQVEAATRSTVSPIQKAMATFADRLQAIEEFSNPGGAPAAPMPSMAFDDFEDELEPAPSPAPKAAPAKAEAKPAAETSSKASHHIPSIPDEDDLGDPWAADEDVFATSASEPAVTDDGFGGYDSSDDGTAFDLDATEFDEADELPDGSPFEPVGSAASMDYLSRARAAANATQDTRKSRAKGTKAVKKQAKSSGSKLPIVAAASILAITAVGTAGYMMMRGKQDSGLEFLGAAGSSSSLDDSSILMPDVSEMSGEDGALVPSEETDLEGEAASATVSSEATETHPPVSSSEASPAPARTEPPPARASSETASPTSAPSRAAVEPEVTENTAATRSLNQGQMAQVTTPAAPVAQVPAQPTPVQRYQQGVDLIDNGRIADGVQLVRQAADDGLAVAQYRVAKLYENGQGVPRDLTQSRMWTARAAESGNVKAMHDLAVFFANGEGGPLNYAGAVQWFRQAAEYGLVDSQYNLGVLYEQGMGVTTDQAEALYWYGVAQKSGDSGAGPKVAELSGRLDPAVAESTLARIAAYRPKPSDAMANGRFPAQAVSAASETARVSSEPASSQAAMVRQAQSLLNELGYPVGVADGEFGAQTRSAILAFQSANGFAQSGQVTPTLIRQLTVIRDSL